MKRKVALAFLFLSRLGLGEIYGDARLYGGGDLMEVKLRPARTRLNRSLGLLRSGFNASRLCATDQCDGDAHCRTLAALTTPQRHTCQQWLTSHVEELLAVNGDDRTPFKVTRAPLSVQGSGGERPTAAMTKLESQGAILFHEKSLEQAGEIAVLALLTHELSHKIPLGEGKFITDEEPVGPFRRGRDFLDAVGAALAVYATRHSVPAQSPIAVPSGACSLAKDFRERYLVGLTLDVTGELSPRERLRAAPIDPRALDSIGTHPEAQAFVRAVVGSKPARARVVQRLFERYLLRAPTPEETRLMVDRISGGVPYEAIVGAIVGDNEYGSMRGAAAPSAWIVTVFHDLLARVPTAEERARHITELQSRTRASTSLSIMKNDRKAWGRWVEDWYGNWLNRPPTKEETERLETELGAGAGWESAMAQLLASSEYVALQALRFESCSR